MEFQAAEDLCVNHGGHLASVASSAELDYLVSLLASYGTCGDGWYEDQAAQICYLHNGQRLTWPQANETCFNMDANLVIIKSKEKNDKIKSFGNYLHFCIYYELY